MVCRECYRRVEGLMSRFRPSFGGYVSVTVLYDSKFRIFTIWAFNEYGDGLNKREAARLGKEVVDRLEKIGFRIPTILEMRYPRDRRRGKH